MTDSREGANVAQGRAQQAAIGIPASLHRLTEQLNDPDSPLVRNAKSRRCDQCHARPGQPCTQRGGFRDDLKGRTIHLGRLEKP